VTVLAAMRGENHAGAELRPRLLDDLEDRSLFFGLTEETRRHLIATQLHAQAMDEYVFDVDCALKRADTIESMGLAMYAGAALQIRLHVELSCGNVERAKQYRERMELLAVRSGWGRQTELWLLWHVALPYAHCGEVVALKHTVRELEAVTREFPGYLPFL